MKPCPFCAEQIQDEAIKCRHCNEFLDGRPRPMMAGYPALYWGYEYRSRQKLFGLPLVHIARGFDPQTGRPRMAKGILAIGNIAIGVFALGGLAVGGVAFGGLSLGLCALGGIALGGVSFGGVALALYLAAGGMAVSLQYALGGMALAPRAISSLGADPEFVRLLERWLPGLRDVLSPEGG